MGGVVRFFSFLLFLTEVLSDCLPTIPLAFDDVHDGDQKQIMPITWNTFKIRPLPDLSEWEVDGTFDINCVAIVDFNVTGKTEYPPVPLKMAMWVMQNDAIPTAVKLGFEFTDPSGTLAPKTQPVNFWSSPCLSDPAPFVSRVSLKKQKKKELQGETCIYTPHDQPEVFNDIKVLDKKGVIVDDDTLTIEPYDNDESWKIQSSFNEGCVAVVNFNVPGYPNPPSAPQEASVWEMASISGSDKDALAFTKLSNGLPTGSPDNLWVPSNE